MHRIVALSLALLFVAAWPRVTTVILVRHAEKATEGMANDPPLSAAGVGRAKELARVLAGTKLAAIYTTPYERATPRRPPPPRTR